MADTSTNYGWFALGAVLGAAIAILYAPKSGSDTREFLSSKVDEGQKAFSETGKELVDKSKDLYERGIQIAEEAAELFERGRRLVRG